MSFFKFISDKGYPEPKTLIYGSFQRFGDKTKKPLWYRAFPDGGAIFGDWRTGESWTYYDQSKKYSRIELKRRKEEAQKARAEFNRLKEAEYEEASGVASQKILQAKDPDLNHPYILKKRITPYKAKQLGNNLIIPIGSNSNPNSLQFISPDGRKKFLPNGKIAGKSLRIGSPFQDVDSVIICEGWATGCSLHEFTGKTVFVAFNATNLIAVAKQVRQNHSNEILIAGDDDHLLKVNIGRIKAEEAAKAVGGVVVFPPFIPSTRKPEWTDWNDYYTCEEVDDDGF